MSILAIENVVDACLIEYVEGGEYTKGTLFGAGPNGTGWISPRGEVYIGTSGFRSDHLEMAVHMHNDGEIPEDELGSGDWDEEELAALLYSGWVRCSWKGRIFQAECIRDSLDMLRRELRDLPFVSKINIDIVSGSSVSGSIEDFIDRGLAGLRRTRLRM